ncbi:MAG: hypothetical protein WCT77_02895 [Bacteroidota bacterium]
MKKTLKKKIRIPLPKQVSKVQNTDKKTYNREQHKRAENFMRIMGWSE